MTSGSPVPTPDCGRRLLPAVIDQRARDEPSRPWCSLPRDDYDLSKGFEDISFSRFANAINKLAWFIEKAIGKSTSFETVAYLGVNDVRYHMMQMAVCKTGHKVLFSTMLNTPAVHVSLMEQTGCNTMFSAQGVHVKDILSSRPMKHEVIPELEELLEGGSVPHYPYEKTYEEAQHDPYLILHTSGTTGDPCISIFGKTVFLPGFRHRTASASEVHLLLPYANASKAFFTPWVMEDIARRPDAAKFIKSFEHVCFGGAVLSSQAASVWAKYTRIQNFWGATEALAAVQLEADRDDYAYNYFDVFTDGYEFRRIEDAGYVSEDGVSGHLYEFVMKMNEKSAPIASWHVRQDIHPSTTKPPLPEWFTGDLWTPHPDPAKAAYAWKFICRKDDLISFSTGVTGHPATIERSITSSEKVRAAILIGNKHQQALALVEVVDGAEPSPELTRKVWEETIEPTNEKVQTHMRVARTHVVLVPAHGFVRTAKGSVVRKHTEEKFQGLIDSVYEEHGDNWQDAKERYGSISQSTEITVEIN
ncbi:hypothetical protein diail_7040 [Diaporthe ilicicola]|nr:hypothetical protein diail_7040 [Diaporthe ilicicola]